MLISYVCLDTSQTVLNMIREELSKEGYEMFV